jgi:nicotinamidase-related amidase
MQEIRSSGKKQIIITGMETHVCVYQTIRRLIAEGFSVFLPQDAVSSRQPANKENALQQIRDMGAVVSNTETLLFDLLKTAGTPLFKQISALIK